MQKYSEFSPTSFDAKGLRGDALDISDWLVLPCGRNRDSDCLAESNFQAALESLGGESDTVQIHRFGHWACGWFEIILVKPGSEQQTIAESIENKLEDYPILNEDDFSSREQDAANETWKNCYNPKERIDYIRKYRSQFDFNSFSDLLQVVRGEYFNGYASELIN